MSNKDYPGNESFTISLTDLKEAVFENVKQYLKMCIDIIGI